MQHQNIVFHGVLKHIPWAVVTQLVEKHNADWDRRVVNTKAHLIAMLYAQVGGLRSLREIETNLGAMPASFITSAAARFRSRRCRRRMHRVL